VCATEVFKAADYEEKILLFSRREKGNKLIDRLFSNDNGLL
jgi:hypothetical protein